MSAPEELTDDAFASDPEIPPGFKSKDGRQQLLIKLGSCAAVLIFLQFMLPQLAMPFLMKTHQPSLFNLKVETVSGDVAVWWRERLWVKTLVMRPGSPPSAVLRGVTAEHQWDRQSDITIPAGTTSILAAGDELFLLDGTGVHRVLADGKLVTTMPKRALWNPSTPFLVDGEMHVVEIDMRNELVESVYREGEWIELQRGALPDSFGTTPGFPRPMGRGARGIGMEAPIVFQNQGQFDGVLVVDPQGAPWLAESFVPLPRPDAPADAQAALQPSPWKMLKLPLFPGTLRTGLVQNGERVLLGTESRTSSPVTRVRMPDGTTLISDVARAFQKCFVTRPDGAVLLVGTNPAVAMNVQWITYTPEGLFEELDRAGDGFGGIDFRSGSFWRGQILLIAITSGLALLLGVLAHVFSERYRDRRYSFGNHTVMLASIGRRGIARAIDVVLFGVPMWCLMFYVLMTMDLVAMMEEILDRPQRLIIAIGGMVLGLLVYGIVMIILYGFLEGVWGTSPGKWCCRIRVIRTTFQRVGLLRGMMRQVLLMIDGQFNYAPAMLMAAFLAKSQRLGDMVADSIVIEERSLPCDWQTFINGGPIVDHSNPQPR